MKVLLLFALLHIVHGWGPIAHYQFACSEFAGEDDLETCIKDHPDLISGDDFPDAFYFGSFIGGNNCTTFRAFHNNAFATQLLLSAKKRQPNASFNSTAFALGYASHMYADDVGFYSNTLNPPSTYLNWLKVWTYMVSIDAALATAAGLTSVKVPLLPKEGSVFIAEVAAEYKKNVDPTAPDITADQVGWCADAWQEVLRDKTAEALDTLEATWRHQLVEFSPYNATSSEQALQQLVPAQQCVAATWRYYYGLVNTPGAKPGVVDAKALAYIEQAFADGKCTPPALQLAGVHTARTPGGGGSSSSSSDGSGTPLPLIGPLGLWPEAG